tara:strand:- start:694 stop:954 length:261 start_codon:yes stop_codon:yes gene_type:complete
VWAFLFALEKPMSKRKTKQYIAGRVDGVALVINTDTMRYLWCHDNAMESVVYLDKGDLTYGCPVKDQEHLGKLKGYIKNMGTRILI